ANGAPFVLELTQCSQVCFWFIRFLILLYALNKFLFFLRILLLNAAHIIEVLVFPIEESIACIAKTLPNNIGLFTRHRTNLFPSFLKLNKLFGGCFPVFAILNSFGLTAQIRF